MNPVPGSGNSGLARIGDYDGARAALRFERSSRSERLEPKQAQRLRNLGYALRALAEELAHARREAADLARENQILSARLAEYE